MILQDIVKVGIIIYLIIITVLCSISITSNCWQYITILELKEQMKYFQSRYDSPVDQLLHEMGIGHNAEFKIEEYDNERMDNTSIKR